MTTEELTEEEIKAQADKAAAKNVKDEDETKAYREQVASEIWDEEETVEAKPEPKEKEPETPKEPRKEAEPAKKEDPPEDPWAGVSPALKDTLENISFRVKQTESRIGSIQNEMHAAKQVAEQTKEAPSEKQIKEAGESQEEWEGLKEEFPAWSKAIDNRLAANSAEIAGKLPDIQGLKESFSQELEKRTVSFYHKDWKATVGGKEYQDWLALQIDEIKAKTNSPHAVDAIYVLDKFTESKNSKKSPGEIAADRKKRLEKSQSLETSHKEKVPKSESDMPEAELRSKIAKEVWAD